MATKGALQFADHGVIEIKQLIRSPGGKILAVGRPGEAKHGGLWLIKNKQYFAGCPIPNQHLTSTGSRIGRITNPGCHQQTIRRPTDAGEWARCRVELPIIPTDTAQPEATGGCCGETFAIRRIGNGVNLPASQLKDAGGRQCLPGGVIITWFNRCYGIGRRHFNRSGQFSIFGQFAAVS